MEVNEAYQTLSNRGKRSTYNDLMFEEVVPRRAHDIFENFFQNRWTEFPEEEEFLKPIFDRRRFRPLVEMGSMMNPLESIVMGTVSPMI